MRFATPPSNSVSARRELLNLRHAEARRDDRLARVASSPPVHCAPLHRATASCCAPGAANNAALRQASCHVGATVSEPDSFCASGLKPPGDPAGEQLDAGDEEPSLSALDGSLEVLGETAIAVEPCNGAFDNPSLRQRLKASRSIGSPDDFDGPSAHFGECLAQLLAGVATIGKDVA